MPFKDEIYRAPAMRGDVGSPLVTITIALDAIAESIEKLAAGQSVAEEIAKIRAQSIKLDKMFDEYTGYYKG